MGDGLFIADQACGFSGTACYQFRDETIIAEGSYSLSTPYGSYLDFTVGEGQLGVYMNVVDINSIAPDMYLVNVWDIFEDDLAGTISYASTDPDGNGIPGIAMVDGAFPGFSWSVDLEVNTVPEPLSLLLVSSGLTGLVGLRKRQRS